MKSLTSSLNAVSKSRQLTRTSSGAASLFIASLIAAAVAIQPVYAATEQAVFEENFPTADVVEASGTAVRLAKLEEAFWICDHTATTLGPDMVDAITCVEITEELKRVKFSGDFEMLTDWWRLNKPAKHAALGRSDAARATESADVGEFPDSI